MKILSITHFNSQEPVRYLFTDPATADAAYQAVKAAMAQFKPYGNDKDATVSFLSDHGEGTFRVDHLTAIAIADLAQDEIMQTTYSRYVGRLRAAFESAKEAARSAHTERAAES